MHKKILLFVYDSFAEFEIAVLVTALQGTGHTLTTVGPTTQPVVSTGRLTIQPDQAVAAIDPDAYDALIIPGGFPASLFQHPGLTNLIQAMHARGKLLAAICAGPALLADSGVLDNASYTASLTPDEAAYAAVDGRGTMLAETLVTDANIVTATGSNYLAFAEEILRHLDGEPEATPLTYFREPSLH
ncbi:DJ-1/PfpI family protein [Longispora albida]|uniref:DJ-1/PfpI family protein n=1 Tax=Longispora albida TaxID=203523 RepID=UPI00035D0C1D|nr:DJ-1/PfpI family protein [Longispora albida]